MMKRQCTVTRNSQKVLRLILQHISICSPTVLEFTLFQVASLELSTLMTANYSMLVEVRVELF